MRPGLRVGSGYYRTGLTLTACGACVALGIAFWQGASADDPPRSTLRIGGPRTSAEQPSPSATATPPGGARLVIRDPARTPSPAPLAVPSTPRLGAPALVIAPHTSPAASSPVVAAPGVPSAVTPWRTSAATSSGAAAYTASNQPPSLARPAPAPTAKPLSVPLSSGPAFTVKQPAAASAAGANSPAAANATDSVSIAGDGSLHDGAPLETTPKLVSPPNMPAAADAALPPIRSLPTKMQATPDPSTAPATSAVETFTPEPLAAETPDGVPADTLGNVPSAGAVDARSLDPTPLDPTKITGLTLEPVDFNGVLLGETTLAEVIESWGDPLSRSGADADARLKYQIDPFAGVELTFVGGKAAAVVVDLGDLFAPADIAQELGLDLNDAAPVEDPEGRTLGLLFPERGVSFRYEDGEKEPRVAHIGLDRIDARPFVMRAEHRREDRPAAALVDLATALQLDPKNSRAHWLQGRVLAAAGRPREALAAVETALRLDPKAAEYLLARAALLADQGLFAAALKDNETVLNGTQKLPNYQARAWRQRGDLLADGLEPDPQQAVDAHTRAVRMAQTLFTDPKVALRRDAKQTLIDAHLALAGDIAWGEWQDKDTAVLRWLEKAEALAKDAILEDGLSPYVILDVYANGLAACVGTRGAVDPLPWAEQLDKAAEAALKDCADPLKRRQIQYISGLGLYDALQALHARNDIDNALRFGTKAVDLIQAGRVGRDEAPTDNYRFGRLYFRIGSLYAVAKNDHQQAVAWFDRAAPLLERPLPQAAAADRGRQGETLVSMGISYWAVGNRERAMRLTEVGSDYMQSAVHDALLEPSAMGVAYSNLAVMHRGLGRDDQSRKFAEMAARAEPTPTLHQGGTLRR